MSDWAWRLISSRTFKAETLLHLPPSPCFSAVFSLFWGNSKHDSAINGLKSQRTGGSSATGTAGGRHTPHRSTRTRTSALLKSPNFQVRSTYFFPSFVSFLPLHQLGMSTCEQVPQREAVCYHLSSALPVDLPTGNDQRVTWQTQTCRQ